MKKSIYILFILPLLFLACGNLGGSEAGNPPSSNRNVIGNLTSTASTSTSSFSRSTLRASSDNCEADLVIAYDSTGDFVEAEAESDCSFDLDLVAGKGYEVEFYLNSIFVADLVFNNDDSSFESPVMIISGGEDAINLGQITFVGFQAFPEFEPATQNDQDGDGVFDFEDEDDNGDGTFDVDESDCDLDGFIDDFDDFFSDGFNCDDDDDSAVPEVLDINPWDRDSYVPLDELVMALFSCDINFDTVSTSSFKITDPLNNTISCNYSLDGGDVVVCEHDSDLFADDTEYTLTISGILCEDETIIPSVSITWNTGQGDEI